MEARIVCVNNGHRYDSGRNYSVVRTKLDMVACVHYAWLNLNYEGSRIQLEDRVGGLNVLANPVGWTAESHNRLHQHSRAFAGW